MNKEKFHIEYIFDKVSRNSLWNHLTTPPGLSSWLADDVTINGNNYTFKWKNTTENAEMVDMKTGTSVRYRWQDDDIQVYFEFLIHPIELTGGTALEITDFAEPDEKEDAIDLWDTQIEALRRSLGI